MNYFSKANDYYNKQDYPIALEYYNKAIESNQYESHSYYNAGVCYIKLKDFDKAIEMITAALKYCKESKYFFNLAYCYSMKKDNQKALRFFNLAWALDNNDKDCERAIKLISKKLSTKA
ncbi:MAG: tetratricopeptide repeat protein [Sarcina sp.]